MSNFPANEIVETGFLDGNSCESDPDAVDNSDSQVSIESCLAYFTKPELLSNEHAWHCENCSKVLRERRMRSREQRQKATSKIQVSGVEDSIQSAPSATYKYKHVSEFNAAQTRPNTQINAEFNNGISDQNSCDFQINVTEF